MSTADMDPRIHELLGRNYPVAMLYEENSSGAGQYAACLLDLPGCIAQGDTEEAALARLEAIKPSYFRQLLRLGAHIPEPTPFPKVVPGEFGFYNERTGAITPATVSSLEGSTQVHDARLQPA